MLSVPSPRGKSPASLEAHSGFPAKEVEGLTARSGTSSHGEPQRTSGQTGKGSRKENKDFTSRFALKKNDLSRRKKHSSIMLLE